MKRFSSPTQAAAIGGPLESSACRRNGPALPRIRRRSTRSAIGGRMRGGRADPSPSGASTFPAQRSEEPAILSWKWILPGPPLVGGLALYDVQVASVAGFVLVLLLFVTAVFSNTGG